MKKHIIGLAIFSFIVFAAAFVYGTFSFSKVEDVFVPQYVPAEKTHCNLRVKSENNSIEVRQAVFNQKTNKFSYEIITPGSDAPVKLHFFSKDKEGTHYLASTPPIDAFSRTNYLKSNIYFKFLWERQSYENLYVIGEFSSESINYGANYSPTFDINRATPVTFDFGENR